MPVRLYNSEANAGEYYLTPGEADNAYKEKERARKVEAIGKLATAYQEYSLNRRDRQKYNQMMGSGSQIEQARQEAASAGQPGQPGQPSIDVLTGPGGSQPQVLNQGQLAQQNAANGVNGEEGYVAPRPGGPMRVKNDPRSRLEMFRARMGHGLANFFSNGGELSPMEKLELEQQFKAIYGDPYGKEAAAAEESRAKARYYDGQLGAPGGQIPEGFIRVNGKLKQDPNFVSADKEMKKLDIAELKKMQETLPKLDQAAATLDQLESVYYKGLNPDSNPVNARLGGPVRTIAAKSGVNPSARTYLNNQRAFAGLIAKGGFGESGVLTQQDIERVVGALPNEYSTKEEAKMAFNEVRNILNSARERYETKKASVFSKPSQSSDSDADPLGLRN